MPELSENDRKLHIDIKDYLNITWEDERTDKKLAGMIQRGKRRLQNIAGVSSIDFIEEGLARELLFDYCRYANSHALEMFETNFIGELQSLHLEYQAGLQNR
ncbi:hypothetical protein [uncultured Clostridium sp.]|jgi:hypothetical protein|uniref:hypothetical protein n=1 Tax=uncultured Clostridium sp. TaxID=59620 RepID=UPI00280BBE60|nr:hypothetical protein [uncultured Clostridium sp.]